MTEIASCAPRQFIGEYKYWPYTPCAEHDLDATEDEVVLNRAPLYRDRRDFVVRSGDTGTTGQE